MALLLVSVLGIVDAKAETITPPQLVTTYAC